MSNAARDAARVLASIRTPARARAARKNGKLGGRPRLPWTAETKGGRIVLRAATHAELMIACEAWRTAKKRRGVLIIKNAGKR